MIPYSRRKLSDLYTLSQSNLLENHILQSGTYLYSPYMAVPPPPPQGFLDVNFWHQTNYAVKGERINGRFFSVSAE